MQSFLYIEIIPKRNYLFELFTSLFLHQTSAKNVFHIAFYCLFIAYRCISFQSCCKKSHQICTKITPTFNAYSARQIGICRQLFKLNISCICFYFASPTNHFSNRSSWYLHFTRVSASYKHHIRRQSATNTSCISFYKNFRGRAIV